MHNGNKFEREPLIVSTCTILIPLIDKVACARHVRKRKRGSERHKKPPPRLEIQTKSNAPPKIKKDNENSRQRKQTRAQNVEYGSLPGLHSHNSPFDAAGK